MTDHPIKYVVTCEHGGNDVPADYADVFDSPGARRALISHRGYDPGALAAASQIAGALKVNLIHSTITRLLIDLNRGETSDELFSRYSRKLDPQQRAGVLNEIYHPYRLRVESEISRLIEAGSRVVHLSIHTFTHRMRGVTRQVDMGVLFDPARSLESRFCEQWMERLRVENPRLRVLANQPYAGTDDGLTTTCRERFHADSYVGVEIEINNRYAKSKVDRLTPIVDQIVKSIPVSRVSLKG